MKFHNLGYKVNIMSLSPRSDIMLSCNPDNRNVSKSDNVNEHKTSFSKTDNNYWLPVTVALAGNPILNCIGEKRLSMNNCNIKVFHFSGSQN